MKKIILGLVAAAAVAAPIALTAGTASAATTCVEVATTTGAATFHATQPSGGGGNWTHTFSVNMATDGGFTGTNVIVGIDNGVLTTVNETVFGQITNGKITLAATRPTGLYTFNWSVVDAPMDGVENSMNVGTTTYATAVDWNGGPLPITFTPLVFNTPFTQDCTTTPDPVVAKDNHGEYVSGAAHAGIKGKALAEIAKNLALVGTYPG